MNESTQPSAGLDPGLVTYTHIIYGLHALSVLIGVTGPATVIGSFVFGLPSIIAVIMNYVRRSEARGTWLESHFAWQLSTFWRAMLWMVVLGVLGALFAITLIGIPIAILLYLGLIPLGLWAIYRIVRGWLKLRDGREP